MASLIEKQDPPTSGRDLKNFGMDALETSFGAVNLALGIGLALLMVPLVSRIPFVGDLIESGANTLTGGDAQAQQDGAADSMWGL